MENQQLEEKFKDIPDDEGTSILHTHFGKIGRMDVKFEFWSWSGYAGVSAIFLKEDVEHLSDEEIIVLVKEECDTKRVQITTPGEGWWWQVSILPSRLPINQKSLKKVIVNKNFSVKLLTLKNLWNRRPSSISGNNCVFR